MYHIKHQKMFSYFALTRKIATTLLGKEQKATSFHFFNTNVTVRKIMENAHFLWLSQKKKKKAHNTHWMQNREIRQF